MLSRQSVITHATLLAIAGATWWLAESLSIDEEGLKSAERGPVDYYSEHVRRIEYGQDGKPATVLVAAKMVHYKQDDRTEMDKPVMTLNRSDGSAPWIIDSDRAVTLSGSDVVFLQGDVLISKELKSEKPLKIITRNVKYSPPRNYAETSEDVLLYTDNDELSGTGMQAQLEPNLVLKVLSNVRRKHEKR